MPGHKRGAAFAGENPLFGMDVTELSTTDNLHYPTGVIAEAQRLAAKAFGAKKTYFLVNGASCGILAMISAVAGEGDVVITDRNCHRSVINALVLTGAKPAFVFPEYDERLGHTTEVTVCAVEEALLKNPEAKAVLITSPNYYGRVSDICEIAKAVHRVGKLLLVDESHGAHFAFSPLLPPTPYRAGGFGGAKRPQNPAALTQSAYLHANLENTERLEHFLRMYQTTSPSYLLMAYLDYAREFMQGKGEVALCNLTGWIRELFPGQEQAGKDMTRLVFYFSQMTGYQAAQKLLDDFNIAVEMADLNNVVCIATVADTKADLTALHRAIGALEAEKGFKPRAKMTYLAACNLALTPRQAFFAPGESAALHLAEGKIAKNTVTIYPPGVPSLVPGEVISKEAVQNIMAAHLAGAQVNGLLDGQMVEVVSQQGEAT